MHRAYYNSQPPKHTLSPKEAEELFATVDNTGHTDKESAERERARREKYGHGVEVDPLTSDDPSGSNVEKVIARAGIVIMVLFVGAIIGLQFYVSHARSENTANLSNNINVHTVASALQGGVEWGGGFTQFPESFSVQEADENTGRIEVSVVDTVSANALVCFSNAQIQAAALSVNSLLNPNVDTVIYHVNVRMDDTNHIQHSSIFGFLRPTGNLVPFMTFIWTKNTTADGEVRFNCSISGVDDELQKTLRNEIAPVSEEELEAEAAAPRTSSRH